MYLTSIFQSLSNYGKRRKESHAAQRIFLLIEQGCKGNYANRYKIANRYTGF